MKECGIFADKMTAKTLSNGDTIYKGYGCYLIDHTNIDAITVYCKDIQRLSWLLEEIDYSIFYSLYYCENFITHGRSIYRLATPTGYGPMKYKFDGVFTAFELTAKNKNGYCHSNFIDPEEAKKAVLQEIEEEMSC